MFKSKSAAPEALAEAIRAKLGHPEWLVSVRVSKDGRAGLVIAADPGDMAKSDAWRLEAESAARAVKGIVEAHAALTAERTVASTPLQKTQRVRKGANLAGAAQGREEAGQKNRLPAIPGIARIIAVASAKGGVGKSTVAVNLAAALARTGMRVGLLDTDIYGPSVPTMLGTVDRQPEAQPDKTICPVEAHDIKSLSIGYLADPDAPMIWRGPVVMSAITQMLNEAAWGTPEVPLDILILDTPPGTGDAALTLAQRVPLSGAILVTTPQEVALADVRRGAAMFNKTAIPILGIVETMSGFTDPSGQHHALFGEGGGRRMAVTLGLPLLAEIPILPAIRAGGDCGVPAALSGGQAEQIFANLARRVAEEIDQVQSKPPPEIAFVDD